MYKLLGQKPSTHIKFDNSSSSSSNSTSSSSSDESSSDSDNSSGEEQGGRDSNQTVMLSKIAATATKNTGAKVITSAKTPIEDTSSDSDSSSDSSNSDDDSIASDECVGGLSQPINRTRNPIPVSAACSSTSPSSTTKTRAGANSNTSLAKKATEIICTPEEARIQTLCGDAPDSVKKRMLLLNPSQLSALEECIKHCHSSADVALTEGSHRKNARSHTRTHAPTFEGNLQLVQGPPG
jgi:hypothetical protein